MSLTEKQKIKVEIFFNMLRGVYGAQKVTMTWPTDKDLQVAKALHGKAIAKHSETELREAIDAALVRSKANDKDYMWPNIPAILGLCRKVSSSAHQLLLSPSDETPEEKAEKKQMRIDGMAKLRAETGI